MSRPRDKRSIRRDGCGFKRLGVATWAVIELAHQHDRPDYFAARRRPIEGREELRR